MPYRFRELAHCLPILVLTLSATSNVALAKPSSALESDEVGPKTLDHYLAEPEPNYSWKIVATDDNEQVTSYVIDLTSLAWLTPQEVDRTEWHHWLIVTKPKKLRHSTAILIVGGGNNGEEAPPGPSDRAERIADQLGAVVVELQQVPNEPLMFRQDGKLRKEDDLIAYAGSQYLKTQDDRWLARLPMVKSVVKAMDTVQSLAKEKFSDDEEITSFVVIGASKRGWTSWLVAGADPRVRAVAPLVIDCLNIVKSMPHHIAAYGFWAPAVGDYERHGLLAQLKQPEYQRLLEIDDPYFHRRRVTMPKFIVNSAGDQYFLPDSSQFYFDALVGEKHLCYVPNTDHSLKKSDAEESIIAFCNSILQGEERPRYNWKFLPDGAIEVTCLTKPQMVRLWQANNPDARDFRLETLGPAYRSEELTASTEGKYLATPPQVDKGWTAYFVEMEFPSSSGPPMKFTTGVRVVPDVLPHQEIVAPISTRAGAGPD